MKILSIIVLAITIFAIGCVNQTTDSESVKEVSVEQAKTAVTEQNAQFIDVRTSSEYAGEHAENVLNCPLDSLDKDLAKLDKSKPVYVICQSGRRSLTGAKKLQDAGFKQVYSVKGGTSEWKQKGLPIAK